MNKTLARNGKGCIAMTRYGFSGRSNGEWWIEPDQQIPGGIPNPYAPTGCKTENKVICEAKMTYKPPTDESTSARGKYLDCPSQYRERAALNVFSFITLGNVPLLADLSAFGF